MKKAKLWMLAAALFCTASFTSCNDDDKNSGSPAEGLGGENRQAFVTHTKASLKKAAENLNFSSMNAANHINQEFNTMVLNNPNFQRAIIPLFNKKVAESVQPVEPGSELYEKGYRAMATVDLTNFNYRFTMRDDDLGFDVEEANDFEMILNGTSLDTKQPGKGIVKLTLKASGAQYKHVMSSQRRPDMAIIAIIPSTFRFVISSKASNAWEELFEGTFVNEINQSSQSEYIDRNTDAFIISGTLTSNIKKLPNSGMLADATTLTFTIKHDPVNQKGEMKFSFIHFDQMVLNAHAVMNDLDGIMDISQLSSNSSILDIFIAMMSGKSMEEGRLNLFDDLIIDASITDCQKALEVWNDMTTARRNYADMNTIDNYVMQLNRLITATMECWGVEQLIPMRLQTEKIGVDYWSVPALCFTDENLFVPITELLDKESISYGINIIDHAVEPTRQGIIVVRQFIQFIQTLMREIQNAGPFNENIDN